MTSTIFRHIGAACIALILSACGGGGGGSVPATTSSSGSPAAPAAPSTPSTPATPPTPSTPSTPATTPSAAAASRFLAQATFGATDESIAAVSAAGYDSWLTSQFVQPQTLHRAYVDQIAATLTDGAKPTMNQLYESFWKQAVTGNDQLRQRMAFALSQIFVVSTQDGTVAGYPRGTASYLDMLGQNSFGNFRQLLEDVALHPMMGIYLSHMRNQKESTTRTPDENFAREVMQLFTIGLYELNADGTPRLRNGAPIETYTHDDVAGLAKVFTGWSWAGPDRSNSRFNGGTPDVDRDWKPMQQYPAFHSTTAKAFLGTSVAAGGTGEADLKTALDTLFNHPNTGPFFARQLIQRLVSSNPSPAYVGRVAAAFANNGSGVRGDMKAVIRAVLLDTEARNAGTAAGSGKLREPVLRLAQWMRSFKAASASGRFLMGATDDPLTSLGQTVLRAPSVFNFYRPGYAPPNTPIASAGLVAPEFQITAEPSVTGYVNFMMDVIPNGTGSSRDIKANYSSELALADNPEALADRVSLLLTGSSLPVRIRNQIVGALNSAKIPAATATNANTVANAKQARVNLAVLLTMSSSAYLILK